MQHPPVSPEADLAQVTDIGRRLAAGEPVTEEEHAVHLHWLHLLTPVLDEYGDIDPLKLGRIYYRRQNGRPLSDGERAAWELLAARGGAGVISASARLYKEHVYEHIRQHSGTIVTERTTWSTDGTVRVTRTVQRFPGTHSPAPQSRCAGRAREHRAAAARRTGASSSTASSDPGGSDSDPPPPPELRPRRLHVEVAT